MTARATHYRAAFERRADPPSSSGADGSPPADEVGAPPSHVRLADWVALALMALSMILSVSAVKLGPGALPFRSIALLACGAVLLLTNGRAFLSSLRVAARPIFIIALASAIGLVVSVLASNPTDTLVQTFLEENVQLLLTICISAALMCRVGVVPVMIAYLFAWGLSTVFVVGQSLHLPFAWSARATIGAMEGDPIMTQLSYIRQERPMGLSFSPVHYALQSCLAVAAALLIRFDRRREARMHFEPRVVVALVVAALACTATGNRSPLVGFALFGLIYVLITRPRAIALLLPLLFLAGLGAVSVQDDLDRAGVRIARTDDGSSTNRPTLRKFGIRLVEDRPIGYGLTVDTRELGNAYLNELRYMPQALAIRQWPVHNYYLNILVRYGVLILFLVPLLVPTSRKSAFIWLAFVPYLVHGWYHNDGPFFDIAIGPFIAAGAVLMAQAWRRPTTRETVRHAWRRAFA